MNEKRTLFFCWAHDSFCTLKKLPYCFRVGCRYMYEPKRDHLYKKRLSGTVGVRA
jgi:hypothetical protein